MILNPALTAQSLDKALSRMTFSPWLSLTFWVSSLRTRIARPALASLLVLAGGDPAASLRLARAPRNRTFGPAQGSDPG
jgi:hypothetical protein